MYRHVLISLGYIPRCGVSGSYGKVALVVENSLEPMQEDVTFRFSPWVRTIPRRRAWQPTPVILPGESHGQRSLEGHSSWGHKESDKTENSAQHKVRISLGRKEKYILKIGQKCVQCRMLKNTIGPMDFTQVSLRKL